MQPFIMTAKLFIVVLLVFPCDCFFFMKSRRDFTSQLSCVPNSRSIFALPCRWTQIKLANQFTAKTFTPAHREFASFFSLKTNYISPCVENSTEDSILDILVMISAFWLVHLRKTPNNKHNFTTLLTKIISFAAAQQMFFF